MPSNEPLENWTSVAAGAEDDELQLPLREESRRKARDAMDAYKGKTEQISLRVSHEDMATLRALAEEQDTGYQTIIKQMIRSKLDAVAAMKADGIQVEGDMPAVTRVHVKHYATAIVFKGHRRKLECPINNSFSGLKSSNDECHSLYYRRQESCRGPRIYVREGRYEGSPDRQDGLGLTPSRAKRANGAMARILMQRTRRKKCAVLVGINALYLASCAVVAAPVLVPTSNFVIVSPTPVPLSPSPSVPRNEKTQTDSPTDVQVSEGPSGIGYSPQAVPFARPTPNGAFTAQFKQVINNSADTSEFDLAFYIDKSFRLSSGWESQDYAGVPYPRSFVLDAHGEDSPLPPPVGARTFEIRLASAPNGTAKLMLGGSTSPSAARFLYFQNYRFSEDAWSATAGSLDLSVESDGRMDVTITDAAMAPDRDTTIGEAEVPHSDPYDLVNRAAGTFTIDATGSFPPYSPP